MLNSRQLIFSVAAAFLPVIAFLVVVLALLSRQEQRATEEAFERQAHAIANAADRQIAEELAALSVLALSEAVRYGDLDRFQALAGRIAEGRPHWLAVVLSDRDGSLVDMHVPADAPSPPVDRAAVAAVFAGARAQVSGVVRQPAWGGVPVVTLHIPVMVGGEVRYALSAVVAAWSFRLPLVELGLAGGGLASLYDRAGLAVARSASASPDDPAVAAPAPPAIGRYLERAAVGATEEVDVAGTLFLVSSRPVGDSGWRVLVRLPVVTAFAPLRESRLLLSGGLGLALLLAGGLAFTFIRAVARGQEAERRVAALEAEQAAERRLADIAANLPGIVFRCVLHADGSVAFPHFTAGLERLVAPGRDLGPEAPPLRPEELAAAMTPDLAERWLDALRRSARTLEPLRVEGDVVDAGGRRRRYRTLATTRRDGAANVVWDGVMLDVTDLHEAETARREQAGRLAFALECADAGLWDWDIGSGRLTWSDGLWRLLGHDGTQGEPSFDSLLRHVHPDDRQGLREAIDAAVAEGRLAATEFRVVHADGRIRWMAATGRTVTDAAGRPLRLTGLDIDITERKRVEQALSRAKEEAERANLAKSKFLAAASHDLRQPVQSLVFFVAALSERLAGHPAAPALERMQMAVDALRQLLDGILDLSKLDAGVVAPQVRPFPAAELLHRLEAQYAPRFADRGLAFRIRPCRATVESDPTLLGRILGNLVENALKYTPAGTVLVGCRRRGDVLRVEVWDTGSGIPPERFDDIFEEFVQIGNPERDRTQGLGLGLAIVQRLARLLGHRLDLRSRPGRGSVFAVEVPLAGRRAGAAADVVAEPAAPS
ncbi:ATP-binding protein [Azospirillum sp. A39]|uniref:ATP-binding protein n=1 Tax=Azospirillum sp. A39 TaxID=3462279 RepID=UPI0040465E6D